MYFDPTAGQSEDKKPKMLVRNPTDVKVTWENTFNSEELEMFKLQILNELKEWKTIYCGNKTTFTIRDLAPCTCYSLRIKLPTAEWIYFKAATQDEGPHSSVMHMSRAVKLGKTSMIRKIAHTRPHLLDTENKENKTPLIQAVEMGDVHLVQLLITLGANVNTPLSYNKRTPLMNAIYNGQIQAASTLIDKKADKNAKDINGLSILHFAVDSNKIESVKFCLDHVDDVNCCDNNGWTPLMRAGILTASEDIINLLLEKGANRDIKDKLGFTFDTYNNLKLEVTL